MTKLFIAGTSQHGYIYNHFEIPYVLESFFYINEVVANRIQNYKTFLLDSGGFTFGASQNKSINDVDDYVERYIKFIKKYDVKYYMELDIENIIGKEKTIYYRNKLEQSTGKPSIPVWNVYRGMDAWYRYCENYDYISIGRISGSGLRKYPEKIKTLLKIAEIHNTKVHLLGMTEPNIEQYNCYSVDSTSWLSGGRFGSMYRFNGRCMEAYNKKDNQRLRHGYKANNLHNLKEWLKYQKHLDKQYKGVR